MPRHGSSDDDERRHRRQHTRTQDDADDVRDPNEDPDQGSPFEKLIEDIQFGADPKEAAKRWDDATTKRAAQVAQQVSLGQRVRADYDETITAFNTLKEKNEALFNDPVASAAMERILHDSYKTDLLAIGVPEDQIPSDPKKRTDAHRLARVHGAKVRAAEKLLGDVKDSYVRWRGGKTPNNPSPAPQRETQPRVVIDRGARRQAIPNQPSRASAPPSAPSAAPQRKTRKEVLKTMRQARGQVTA